MVVVFKPDLLTVFKNGKRVFRPYTSTIKLLLLKKKYQKLLSNFKSWCNGRCHEAMTKVVNDA